MLSAIFSEGSTHILLISQLLWLLSHPLSVPIKILTLIVDTSEYPQIQFDRITSRSQRHQQEPH